VLTGELDEMHLLSVIDRPAEGKRQPCLVPEPDKRAMDLQSIIMRAGSGHASYLRANRRGCYPHPGVARLPQIQEISR
jgi:hypothetical protein